AWTAGAWAHPGLALLLPLHRLREALRAAPQCVERTALGIDGAVSVPLAKLALRLAHGLAGLAKLVAHLALSLLPLLPLLAPLPALALLASLSALTLLALLLLALLAHAALLQLFHQFVELVAQCLLLLR